MKLIPLSRLLVNGRADDHPVAVQRGQQICFGQFRADVMAATSRFDGCRSVALVCQDSYNFIVGFFGLLHAGATIVIPPNGQFGSLCETNDKYDLIANDAVIEDRQTKIIDLNYIDPNQLSLVFWTSGSTGTPKRIPKSLAMLEREVTTLDSLWGNTSRTGSVFATVSHQHIYGLTFKLLWPIMAGRPFMAEMHAFWESLIAVLSPDAVLVSSPAHLSRLDGILSLPQNLTLKRIFSAGAPLSFEASKQAERILGCSPTEIFGSTETGAFATRCQIDNDAPWQLFPDMSIRCDGGRLILSSPFIGPGWLETSDLIEPIENGFRHLGRADRIAKIEGKRVSLAQVEQSLTQLSFVEAAAVAVLQNEPDCLVAVVVPSEEGQAAINEMGSFRFGRFLRSKLALTQEASGLPRLWRFVNELPARGLGKRSDADIRALFSEGA